MRYLSLWKRGLLAVVLCGFTISATSAHSRPALLGDYVPNEVLVRLNLSANIRAIAAAYHLRGPRSARDQIDHQPIYRFEIADGASPADKAAVLKKNHQVLYAEPNYIGDLPEARQRSSWVVGDDVGGYTTQWAPAALRLPEAHALSRGANVTVALLDTGADLAHPALAGHLAPGYDFVDQDDDPSELSIYSGASAYGHGTHVAGLVALAAPDAMIMPLRTLGPDGFGTIWNQALGLRYAITHGADVISLSFSFHHRSILLDNILAEVTCLAVVDSDCSSKTRPGAIVTAAAGNSGTSERQYPAGDLVPGVLAVGASTATQTLAAFSTYGSWVQVAAPGDHILSSVPGGAYATWSGTSMSTPLAAGVAALLRSKCPTLRPIDVIMRIVTTAAPLDGLVRRRVDAAAALGMTSKK